MWILMKAVICKSGMELVGNLMVADSIFTRMKGLLGRDSLPEGSGLWLKPCKGIHTFGMQFAIDIVFLDKENRVVELISEIGPNRMTSIFSNASTVLELPAKTLSGTNLLKGDMLIIE